MCSPPAVSGGVGGGGSAGYFAAAAAAGIVAAAHPDTFDGDKLANAVTAAAAGHAAHAAAAADRSHGWDGIGGGVGGGVEDDGEGGGGGEEDDEESRAAFEAALARREARVREAHIQLRMRALKAGKRERLGIVPRRSTGGRSARSSSTSNGLVGLDASAWGLSGDGDGDECDEEWDRELARGGSGEEDDEGDDADDGDGDPDEGEITGMLSAGPTAAIGTSGGGDGDGGDGKNPGGGTTRVGKGAYSHAFSFDTRLNPFDHRVPGAQTGKCAFFLNLTGVKHALLSSGERFKTDELRRL